MFFHSVIGSSGACTARGWQTLNVDEASAYEVSLDPPVCGGFLPCFSILIDLVTQGIEPVAESARSVDTFAVLGKQCVEGFGHVSFPFQGLAESRTDRCAHHERVECAHVVHRLVATWSVRDGESL